MADPERDTIAAVATPPGRGGVGVIRVSGPAAAQVLGRVVGQAPEGFADRVLRLGVARGRGGERLDEVLYVLMRGPRSFTGEDVGEIHGHGGSVNMGRLLRAALDAGARPAEPGEFSRRAFENGRLDLTRAEAVLEVIGASTERACRLAQAQLDGALASRVVALEEEASRLQAELEAEIDFPEEGLEVAGRAEIRRRAASLAAESGALAASYRAGRALREGIEVAFRGPVNAGKSSVFNALAGAERAIVDPEPGTTRDFVEAALVWDGVPVTLIDTAGERDAGSRVERRGIELGEARSERADVVVWLHPAPDAVSAEPPAAGARELHVVSKGDLLEGAAEPWLVTSAQTGRGLDALVSAILERAGVTEGATEDELLVTSERQRALFEEASAAFGRAATGADELPAEVLAEELRQATQHLAHIRGAQTSTDVLDTLFSQFCIGK